MDRKGFKIMKEKFFCTVLVAVVAIIGTFWLIGYIGHTAPRPIDDALIKLENEIKVLKAEIKTKPEVKTTENECICGLIRTCEFGTGIIGSQYCKTDAFMVNRWTRCEPAK